MSTFSIRLRKIELLTYPSRGYHILLFDRAHFLQVLYDKLPEREKRVHPGKLHRYATIHLFAFSSPWPQTIHDRNSSRTEYEARRRGDTRRPSA